MVKSMFGVLPVPPRFEDSSHMLKRVLYGSAADDRIIIYLGLELARSLLSEALCLAVGDSVGDSPETYEEHEGHWCYLYCRALWFET